MTEQNNEKQLDEMLDSLLATYSSVEPRPGLQTRILAGVREAAAGKTSWSWNLRWLGAGVSAAVLIVAMFLVFTLRHRRVEPDRPLVRENPEPPAPTIQSTLPMPESAQDRQKLRRHPQGPLHNLPRVQDASLSVSQRPTVFPTPVALSEAERLMLAYIAKTPKDELIAQVRIPGAEEEEFWKDRQPAVSGSQR